MAPRVAFLGTPAAAVPALKALAEAIPVTAVFCNADKPTGRGRKLEAPPVKTAAVDLGLPVHQPLSWRLEETRKQWEELRIDLAVVVAYGHLLPDWMLDGCRLGAWNLHFSLLPRWRGAAPVNHAILAGDSETGVALMRITSGLDEGPVLGLHRRPILDTDRAEGLLEALAQASGVLLAEHLPTLFSGQAVPTPQALEGATYASKLHKSMASLDCLRAASELHRQVRGLAPWPGTEIQVEGTTLKICGVGGIKPCHELPGTLHWSKQGACLTAGDGLALELTELQRPGKPVQPALQALQPWGASGRMQAIPDPRQSGNRVQG